MGLRWLLALAFPPVTTQLSLRSDGEGGVAGQDAVNVSRSNTWVVARGCGLEAPGFYPDQQWPPSVLCGNCDDLCAGVGGTCDAEVTASVSSCEMMEGILLADSTIGRMTG